MNNVLVTGGAGFIGYHLVKLLLKEDYNVVVIDNFSTGKSENKLSGATYYNLDINSEEVKSIFAKYNFDFVFHLAAQANVTFSTNYPEIDAKENIIGSINILKLCKAYKVKKIILASTAAVYGKPNYLPVDEEHSVSCLSCYGLSKYAMEQYTKLLDVNHIILRFANVYGPRQSAKGEAGVVAIFADKMNNNQPIIIDDDGEQTRDFVYVDDIAKSCLLAIKCNIKNTIINVSTSQATSINELFHLLSQIYGYKLTPTYGPKRFGDIRHSLLDNTRCKEKLNFIPSVKLKDGLQKLKQG